MIKNKISLTVWITGLIGIFLIILGTTEGSKLFSSNYVFGAIALLFSIHVLEAESLEKRIKKLESKK